MRRGQTYGTGGHSADCRRRMEAALTQNEEYQFKVEQANFRKDQNLAEEVERSTKRRRETIEGLEGHVLGQGDQEPPEGGTQSDQEMVMESHETKRGVIARSKWPTIRGKKGELNAREGQAQSRRCTPRRTRRSQQDAQH